MTKIFFVSTLLLMSMSACTSISSDKKISSFKPKIRTPANQQENGAPVQESLHSYKLPLTRNGITKDRVAYTYWSGEHPMPVIDVNHQSPQGTTVINALSELRNLSTARTIRCTVKNGIYSPSVSNPVSSIMNFYTLTAAEDYEVIKATRFQDRDSTISLPVGSRIINVIYGSERYCGATLVLDGRSKPIASSCDYFSENENFKKISEEDTAFADEQWLHLVCEEKDRDGKNIKAFVQDHALLGQPGIKESYIGLQ